MSRPVRAKVEVMTAPRRLLAAALVMIALVALSLLLWKWLPGPSDADPQPSAEPVASASVEITGDRQRRASSGSSPRSLPRLRPAAVAIAEPGPLPMPEGLAQDLEMFDGVQLKAELESIALSHPEVRVVEAICSGLPCRAQASSSSAEQLTAFTRAVHQRFQGHVSIRTDRLPGQLRATVWVGTAPERPAELP
jgi:hypothetical protein